MILNPQFILLFILAAMALLYVTRWLPTEVTSLLVIFSLAATGVLSSEQAFSGFSSPATVTVAAMFVLSAGLMRTGALDLVASFLVRWAGRSIRRLILLMGLFIPITSAFINNTPVVIMMVPILLSVCRRLNFQPSKVMIPLSYLSILGGTMTLIGTSTNILIDDLYRKAGGPGFGFFEFMPLGIIFTLVGTIYLLLFSRRFLPTRAPLASLISNRRETPYVTELVVPARSRLVGKPVTEAFRQISSLPNGEQRHRHIRQQGIQRRRLSGRIAPKDPALHKAHSDTVSAPNQLELLAIYRANRAYLAEETKSLQLQEADLLLVAGTPERLDQFMKQTGGELATVLEDDERVPMSDLQQKVVEAVVLPNSPYRGQFVRQIGLNQRFSVKIMGLQRNGQQFSRGLRDIRLESGMVLLLQGELSALSQAAESAQLMIVEGIGGTIPRRHKNRLSLLVMVNVVVLAAMTQLSIGILAVAGAALMIALRCINVDEAVDSLSTDTLLLLSATIPLGLALQTTGMAQTIVDGLLVFGENAPPLLFLSILFLLTFLLTQLLSNNAVAVLFTPISLTLAVQLGIDAKPLLMAVAFGASTSFMTPMGYQTNAIVMGPGGYTFSDFLRLGVPLSIIMWLLATFLIPIIWPLG
ncbi:MAG: SLC13 family permease [Chloroflexota bacterium]